MNRKLAAGLFSMALLAMAAMPTTAFAQRRAGGGGGGGGGGGAGGFGGGRGGMGGGNQLVQQTLQSLDLQGDEKTKVDQILADSRKEMTDAMQGFRDLSREEQAAKMKDVQKMQADTKDKIVAALTPEEQTKFASKLTDLTVTGAADRLTGMTKAAETADISDDKKASLKPVLTDATKTLDGYKTDAAAVKDMAGSTELSTKVTTLMTDTNKKVMEIIGQDDMQTWMQAVRQATPRPAGGRNAGGAGGGNGGNGGGRRNTATPTTAPTL